MFGFSVADWIFIVLVIFVIFFFVALSGMNKRKN
ncbi:twin-arginine translocase TatA/TatE family subunit [bacterium]|nr:twin-arginine translocase TatA/TatE family subunit [bacterium]